MNILNSLFLLFCLVWSTAFIFPAAKKPPSWVTGMDKKVRSLEKNFEGEFGVYVLDLESSEEFSHKSSEFWYLSSTIKVPVAIGLLKMVDEKKIDLSEKVTIAKSDYRDGAGPVNWLKPGSKVSYKYLLKQMLIYSDNAATDLIIKKVGLDSINSMVANEAIAKEFGPITTLLDVRKKAYGEIHPDAEKLPVEAFFAIKKAKTPKRRIAQLAKELKISKDNFKFQTLDEGFNRYYSKHWNSATLRSYAQLLRKLVEGQLLSEESTLYLLKIMSGIQTGKKRIRRGLKNSTVFAHKTGTQHRQACDLGIARTKGNPKPKVLILVCTRNWKKLSNAELLMANIGKIISQTQLLKIN